MAENVERSQRGNSSLFGLFALARQEQRLAGRKAIVYFSEGLQVPNQLQPLYRSVVSEANRANLSIYSVDTRGLRTTSDFDRTRTDLTKSRENVRRQVQSRGGRAVTREDVLAGEVAEDAITMNAQGMLGALSESTGGRLIANSNDVRTGLGRAIADTSGYYEITYDPQLAAFDGSFRRIAVKVKRPGVSVQAREGYFALPPGEGSVDFPWELPLLKMLKTSPAPHDFDTRAAAYHFGPENGEVRYTLVAEIPLERALLRGQGRHAQGPLLRARDGARREGRGARALRPGLAGRGAREEPRRPEAAAMPCSRAASPCRRGATLSSSWSSTRWRSTPRCARASSSSRRRGRGSPSPASRS